MNYRSTSAVVARSQRMGLKLPKTELLIQHAIRPCLAKTPIASPGWSYV
jgi:hypothetical protein